MELFDWVLWACLSLLFWAAYRLQSLGLLNPQHAHRLWIALALPSGAVVALVLSAMAWQSFGIGLALVTLLAAAATGIVLAIAKKAPVPVYIAAAVASPLGYLWRLSALQ